MASLNPRRLANRVGGAGSITRVNVLSLVVQAGLELRRGNRRRAAVLFGAAALAPRATVLSYAVQGGVALDALRRRLP